MPGLRIFDREAFALEIVERDLRTGQRELLEIVADRAEVGFAIGHRRDHARFGFRAEPFERFADVAFARVGVERRIDAQRLAARPARRTARASSSCWAGTDLRARACCRPGSLRPTAHRSRRGCARKRSHPRTATTRRSARNGIAATESATPRARSSVAGPSITSRLRARMSAGIKPVEQCIERALRQHGIGALDHDQPVDLRRLVEKVVIFHATRIRARVSRPAIASSYGGRQHAVFGDDAGDQAARASRRRPDCRPDRRA